MNCNWFISNIIFANFYFMSLEYVENLYILYRMLREIAKMHIYIIIGLFFSEILAKKILNFSLYF